MLAPQRLILGRRRQIVENFAANAQHPQRGFARRGVCLSRRVGAGCGVCVGPSGAECLGGAFREARYAGDESLGRAPERGELGWGFRSRHRPSVRMDTPGSLEQICDRLFPLPYSLTREGALDTFLRSLEPRPERALLTARQFAECLEDRATFGCLDRVLEQGRSRAGGEFLQLLTERGGAGFVRLKTRRVIGVSLLHVFERLRRSVREMFPTGSAPGCVRRHPALSTALADA